MGWGDKVLLDRCCGRLKGQSMMEFGVGLFKESQSYVNVNDVVMVISVN